MKQPKLAATTLRLLSRPLKNPGANRFVGFGSGCRFSHRAHRKRSEDLPLRSQCRFNERKVQMKSQNPFTKTLGRRRWQRIGVVMMRRVKTSEGEGNAESHHPISCNMNSSAAFGSLVHQRLVTFQSEQMFRFPIASLSVSCQG